MININGTYFQNPTFPNNVENNNQIVYTGEQSFIENILRNNIGEYAKIYASFPDSNEWRDKIFSGIIEDSGKDHLIIHNKEKDDWYLIPLIYLNWVEFEAKIKFITINPNNNLNY